MKKTLLAAALLAGFATAGVAQAETSVTMYGILDTGYGYSKFKKDGVSSTTSGLVSGIFNGNRWGVRGSEDLGDGLRAVFQLEAGFDIGNANNGSGPQDSVSNKFFHRQAFVGLASDSWGTFTMGRQYNIGSGFNVANTSVSFGDMDKTFGAVGLGSRMDNSFKYVTPSFSGFQAGVAYGNPNREVVRTGVDANDEDRTNWTSAGLKYANGPIALGVSYDRSSNGDNEAISNWAITGAYDFEVVKLALAYGQDRHGKLGWGALTDIGGELDFTNGTWDDFKSNNYYVGLSAPVAGGTVALSWAMSDSNLDDTYATGVEKQNIYHINYQYPLSKRTKVYAYASYGKGIGYVEDQKGTEAGLGLNHSF